MSAIDSLAVAVKVLVNVQETWVSLAIVTRTLSPDTVWGASQLTSVSLQMPPPAFGGRSVIVQVPGAMSASDGVAATGTPGWWVTAVALMCEPDPESGVSSKPKRPVPPSVILEIRSDPAGGTQALVNVQVTCSSATRWIVSSPARHGVRARARATARCGRLAVHRVQLVVVVRRLRNLPRLSATAV